MISHDSSRQQRNDEELNRFLKLSEKEIQNHKVLTDALIQFRGIMSKTLFQLIFFNNTLLIVSYFCTSWLRMIDNVLQIDIYKFSRKKKKTNYTSSVIARLNISKLITPELRHRWTSKCHGHGLYSPLIRALTRSIFRDFERVIKTVG